MESDRRGNDTIPLSWPDIARFLPECLHVRAMVLVCWPKNENGRDNSVRRTLVPVPNQFSAKTTVADKDAESSSRPTI